MLSEVACVSLTACNMHSDSAFCLCKDAKKNKIRPGWGLFVLYVIQIHLPAVFFSYNFFRQLESKHIVLIYSTVKDKLEVMTVGYVYCKFCLQVQ